MSDLPGARSLSADSLELLWKIAVRAVVERGMTHREFVAVLGVGENAVGGWCAGCRQVGLQGLEVNQYGWPLEVGRSLLPTMEIVIQAILLDSTPEHSGITPSRLYSPSGAGLDSKAVRFLTHFAGGR